MQNTGKNVATDQDSNQTGVSKGEIGSILIASLLKKGSKISNRRKHKQHNLKNNTDAKKDCLNPMKKKVPVATASKEKVFLKRSYDKNPNVDGEYAEGDEKAKKIRRRKKKKQKGKVEPDEALRLQRRTRYLLIKMKQEQNLIDAYSTEGWKGQSREKIKPEKELQRARNQILKCKLGIRDAVHQLDSLSSVGSMEERVIAPDGSVHHEHIFCAKCKLREAFPDNDIVLCDGTCNRAFHQKCLDPPLDTDSIPPGDQGWFCQFCVCKMEIIESINAHIGTHFPVDSKWQDIFREEAILPSNADALLNTGEDWPSDDSQDDDYDPETRENSCNIDSMSNDDDEDGESSSTDLSWSLDGKASCSGSGTKREGDYRDQLGDSGIETGETSNEEILSGPRQRRAVDYRKLHDEMFGKDVTVYEQVSEDEDWGPSRKRGRKKESSFENTLATLGETDEKRPNIETAEQMAKLSSEDKIKRLIFRFPPEAVERLRQVFAENELPSRSVKENLSKELDLTPEKISKWFKNARYLALKSRKTESTKQLQGSAGFSYESGLETAKKKIAETNAAEDASTETNCCKINDSTKIQKAIYACSSHEKSQHAGESSTSPTNDNKATDELSDDLSLKNLLEAKKKRESKKAEGAAREYEAFEAEMERLCRAQNRLLEMKQRILRLQNLRGRKKLGKSSGLPEEGSVMYVPVAELKEKP